VTWIRTVPWDEATGVLKAAYDWQAASLGQPAEFTMLGSPYPEIVEERLRLYKVVEGCPSGLSPIERQLACLVTSLLNRTAHCASGLLLKLRSLGLSDEQLEAVRTDPAGFGLEADAGVTNPVRLLAIARHAAKLTTRPTEMTEDDLAALRAHGLGDLELVDLNNLVAYYNYINRVVMGLGLRTVMSTEHEATQAVPR
jgi:uncharacterized peroxidase-related enzyme